MSKPIHLPGGKTLNIQPDNEILAAIRALEVIEPEKIQCLEYRVLVKVADAQKITDGGILKPGSAIEKELFANTRSVIVNVGAEAFLGSNGQYIESRPQPGDVVVISKYAGLPMRDKDYNLYRFANDKDIVAIVKE